AQMEENRQQIRQPSLDPRAGLIPSPVPVTPISGIQHGQFAPYQGQGIPLYTTRFVDPEHEAFPDAPPAYTPGPSAPRHLVNREGVNRPYYG
ncbi:MAG: hypothetical protein Q9184_008340, partial [Pyrenodesmia sp. 2 TL-2023]